MFLLQQKLFSIGFIISALFIHSPSYAQSPPIQLATQFRDEINIEQYYVSEKLDGVRAYWDGHKLISRQGNIFTAPAWFTRSFPKEPLDGELWIARQEFEKVSGIVRTQNNHNEQWQQVTYMIFDLPNNKEPFSRRITRMQHLVEQANSPYLQIIKQQKIKDNQTLQILLNQTVMDGGEGLMLHHQGALYQTKRNRDLMKLKKFEDAEAIIIAHIPGKGKYQGLLGAILVETKEGIRFKIGSGFSDQERKSPPAIGSVITYRFTGKTRNNIPRFASYMRVRVIY
ncbi:DNA ligase [Psychromonas sp. RZ22]|uniref:DNA ligase n=1 Tax=Psychromonas algarum TaxID=2555643 RepID=UPI001068CEC9|nr:DNA ligase [Psychromonas sp. RZ22]TEW54911.1 DNA ligase [Psychromonas sp. RZ22]